MPLFSRKKSSKEDENPYAQQNQHGDPYSPQMTSLQRTQADLGLPVNGRAGRPGLPSGPGPRAGGGPSPQPSAYGAPPSGQSGAGGYGAPPPRGGPSPQGGAPGGGGGGYSAGGYGAQGGYGSNKYGSNGSSSYGSGDQGGYGGASRQSGARRGGYGGLGGNEEADDSSRQALFGNAPQKFATQAAQAPETGRPGYDINKGYGAPRDSAGGDGGAGGYGDDRELTTEEQEDEDVKRMNQETRYLRNETDQSLDRSLMIANQSIETARATMARMHNQRERLLNVESNLDAASNHNKIAEHRAAELKHYNRSMFAVKVNNPFTSKQRAAAQAQSALDEHRAQRDQREETRRLAYQSTREAEQQFDKLDKAIVQGRQLGQSKTGQSSKFNLEDDDEEDIAMERGIDNKIGLLENAVGTMNLTAKAMGEFVEDDLQHIDRIAQKSDAVDDQVRANRYRLERIEKRG